MHSRRLEILSNGVMFDHQRAEETARKLSDRIQRGLSVDLSGDSTAGIVGWQRQLIERCYFAQYPFLPVGRKIVDIDCRYFRG